MRTSKITSEFLADYTCKISEYILRLGKIKRHTEKKIKLGQHRDLLVLVNEIDVKRERQLLFEAFDHYFLEMFPSFMEDFNSLLKPEDQIWPKEKNGLNTSLRVFALMRLGIKDNQEAAIILESSVSTVYTYKFRIKSKAIVDWNVFENKIMSIKCMECAEQSMEN